MPNFKGTTYEQVRTSASAIAREKVLHLPEEAENKALDGPPRRLRTYLGLERNKKKRTRIYGTLLLLIGTKSYRKDVNVIQTRKILNNSIHNNDFYQVFYQLVISLYQPYRVDEALIFFYELQPTSVNFGLISKTKSWSDLCQYWTRVGLLW